MSKISKVEVMNHLDKEVLDSIPVFLKPIEEIWQPADLLPESDNEEFFDQIKEIQYKASNLSYSLLAVLIGDTITEEVLPTYETWLSMIRPVNEDRQSGWNQWTRAWTAEENRHGDVLNRYLYLCGRVNMREMEISTQHLLAVGFGWAITGACPGPLFAQIGTGASVVIMTLLSAIAGTWTSGPVKQTC